MANETSTTQVREIYVQQKPSAFGRYGKWLIGALVLANDGDPGVTHDVSTSRADLPPCDGPPEPAAHAEEWGVAGADEPDDAPVPGPSRLGATGG